jgi:anti-sigma B factor antagonist
MTWNCITTLPEVSVGMQCVGDARLSTEREATSKHPYLTIEVTNTPQAQTIALAGEADLLGAPKIEAVLEDASAGDSELIVIDLRGLTFIDSSGLHALVIGHQLCRTRGHELRIIAGPTNVQRLFELTGADDLLPFCDAELDS